MPVTAAPSTSFETVADGFSTGLTGTIGVRVIDNDGATTIARVTAGIVEYPASTGIYQKTLTAPATSGQYTLVWDDGTNYATDDLVITPGAAVGSTGSIYATREELKQALSASGTTYLDDDLDDALNAASRAIDDVTDRRFFPTTETRVYTADYPHGRWAYPSYAIQTLEIDDLNTLTTLKVDNDGDGVYETTWVNGTDFLLDPPNAPLIGYPYERVLLSRHGGQVFPVWNDAIQIAGSFGFATCPPEVKQYTKIFAAQLMLRSRQAPFGILMAGVEIGAMTRLSRFDPDFDRLLGHLVKPSQLIA